MPSTNRAGERGTLFFSREKERKKETERPAEDFRFINGKVKTEDRMCLVFSVAAGEMAQHLKHLLWKSDDPS